ncbi:MAG: type II secretion system F family protein [Candidatus Aenigmatarchaeota archaeon]|nr:MAG: type II secretion system F family protein [Candidatus Aenigmarchaeota archaeon]
MKTQKTAVRYAPSDTRRVPMFPVSMRTAKAIGELFRGVGGNLVTRSSALPMQLRQADMNLTAAEYMGFSLFVALLYGIVSTAASGLLEYRTTGGATLVTPAIGVVMFIVTFFFVSSFPRVFAIRVAKETEKDMLGAMRHLLIEVRSGVSLFHAMVGLTKGYGRVSVEFDAIVRDINSGMKEVDALNRAAERNTSIFFRRTVWQMVNSLRAGSDVSTTLESITDAFTKNQIIRIRQYGQELNPLTMLYMIFSVILPSLGITFLIVLSSISGLAIPPVVLPLIIVVLVVFQFFFIGYVKTRRPNVTV